MPKTKGNRIMKVLGVISDVIAIIFWTPVLLLIFFLMWLFGKNKMEKDFGEEDDLDEIEKLALDEEEELDEEEKV